MPSLLAADSRAMALIAELPAATKEDVRVASLEADTMARSANASLEAEIRSLSLRVKAIKIQLAGVRLERSKED